MRSTDRTTTFRRWTALVLWSTILVDLFVIDVQYVGGVGGHALGAMAVDPLVVETRTYNYNVDRPDKCGQSDEHFANCYLCGKLTEAREIYFECCAEKKKFLDFCDRLLV